MREAKHPAMACHHGQAAVAIALPVAAGHLCCGSERGLSGSLSLITDDTSQQPDDAEQDQKYEPLVHGRSD